MNARNHNDRGVRSVTVSLALEHSSAGWDRDPYRAGAVGHYTRTFPNLPIVADGRDVTNNTRKGRGTTAFDLFRSVPIPGTQHKRVDLLSIKTATIGKDGKLPSKVECSTGNEETLQGLIEGIHNGGSLATVIFASENDPETGEPSSDGYALFVNLGPVLRAGIAEPLPDGERYGRGRAPTAYYKWSSSRKCGGKSKHIAREGLSFPHIDEKGRKWTAPDRVCYRELVVSLASMGVKREAWVRCNIRDIPAMVNGQDWDAITYGY